jgi:hypothetical protein
MAQCGISDSVYYSRSRGIPRRRPLGIVYDRLDIDYWMSVFSVRRMREAGEKPDANIISGPYDIAVVE